jgi:hypothetical protein
MNPDIRPVVITLHGIRTRGAWQKEIAPRIARYGMIPVLLDYGYFNLFQFLNPWARDGRVKWLRDEVAQVVRDNPHAPVSIVAHSLGTYLVARLMFPGMYIASENAAKYTEAELDYVITPESAQGAIVTWPPTFQAAFCNAPSQWAAIDHTAPCIGRPDVIASVAAPLSAPGGAPGRVVGMVSLEILADQIHTQSMQALGVSLLLPQLRELMGAASFALQFFSGDWL